MCEFRRGKRVVSVTKGNNCYVSCGSLWFWGTGALQARCNGKLSGD